MKNVYIIDEIISSKTNGIGTFLRSYLSCLQEIEVNVCIIAFNADVNEFGIKIEKGIKKMLFPVFPWKNFLENGQVVNRFLKLYIPDSADNIFCFNHSPCKDLLQSVKDSFPLSKIVFTIHDMGWSNVLNGNPAKFKNIIQNREKESVTNEHHYLLKFFDEEKQIFDTADAVVCLTESTRKIVQHIYKTDKNKIHLITSGLKRIRLSVAEEEKTQIRRDMRIAPDEKILLYVGRLSYPKGVYSLLSSFYNILKTYPETRLILAGSANKEWTEFFSFSKYVASRIITTGFVNRKELNRLYSIADIGIIPSYYEQCPYVGMEMMMHGLPIVASGAEGLKDMFTDGINARVAKIGKQRCKNEFSRNLQNALTELLSSKESRDRLGKQAKQTFDSKYEVRHMRERYRNFLYNL